MQLPLFPLNSVLLPGAPLPLHVFEPRYRQLVEDLLEQPEQDRRFGVVAIREGRDTGVDGVTSLYPVGCVALVTDVQGLPDGRYYLESVGVGRFRILPGTLATSTPYFTSEVELLAEREGAVGDLPATVAEAFAGYLAGLARAGREVPSELELPADPLVLSYLLSATVVLDLEDRQSLLEAEDAAARLYAVGRLLHREISILHVLPSVPGGALVRAPFSLS